MYFRPAAYSGIPYDKRVGTGILDLPAEGADLLLLPLVKADIDRYEHSRPEFMGIVAKTRYLSDGITGVLAGPESRACDVNGIGTAVNCRDADISRSRRSEKFKGGHPYLSEAARRAASGP